MRIGTYSANQARVDSLQERQTALQDLQAQVSSGKRVLRSSDDPQAMGRAERARVRLERLKSEQQSLDLQKGRLAQAESTLGQAGDVLQSVRDLLLSAGQGALSVSDRASLAQQVRGLSAQLLSLANQRDANGTALFGGLGVDGEPLVATPSGTQFSGQPGQAQAGAQGVPGTLDGQHLWIDLAEGNGRFRIDPAAGNAGSAWADAGQVDNPTALTGHRYRMDFSAGTGSLQWQLTDQDTGSIVGGPRDYRAGEAITVDGLRWVVRGQPQPGDALTVSPSVKVDVFTLLSRAADALQAGGVSLPGELSRSLTEVDGALDRVLAGRSQAGQWLAWADTLATWQQEGQLQQEQARSQAEDVDMVQALSSLQNLQSGHQAALKSYAQIQSLTLFDFLK